MRNRERVVVTSVFIVLIFGWLGFLLHVSPRFAGSRVGLVLGIAGAGLMLVPLAYTAVKRSHLFKTHLTKYISLQTWLSIHIYTGIVGALLALIHTGHKFYSPLGIALTATMMLVVVSGFVLRYLTPFVNLDIKDKLLLLQTARGDLDNAWGVVERSGPKTRKPPTARFVTAGIAAFSFASASEDPVGRVVSLADGVADLEYSIRTDDLLRRWFGRALTFHILLSVAMYTLLALHIWAAIYFGMRWSR